MPYSGSNALKIFAICCIPYRAGRVKQPSPLLSRACYSIGKYLLALREKVAKGIDWMCLCRIDMPERNPRLKKQNAPRLYMVRIMAAKSDFDKGTSYLSISLVTMIECSLQMLNLLNRRRCVCDRSAMNIPSSNGFTNGFFLTAPVFCCLRVGFNASILIKRTSKSIP